MVNEGQKTPKFRKGAALKGEDLRKIARGQVQRVTGGKGVQVSKGANGSLTIKQKQQGKRPAPDRIVAHLTSETGDGVYAFALDAGLGPATGECTEVALTTGIAADTPVVLHRVGGVWWFSVAGAGGGAVFPAKIANVVDPTHYQVDLYESGFDNPATTTSVNAVLVDSTSFPFSEDDQVTVFQDGDLYYIATSRVFEYNTAPTISFGRVNVNNGDGSYSMQLRDYPGAGTTNSTVTAYEMNGSTLVPVGHWCPVYFSTVNGLYYIDRPFGDYA